MSNQKGFTPIIVIIILGAALVIIGSGYYLGTLAKPLTKTNNSQPSIIPTPTPTQILTSSPKPTTIYPSASVTQTPASESIYKRNLPSDIPLFNGANLAYDGRIKSCGYLENDKFCEVNFFLYHITKPGVSVKEVLDWYVSNPNPSWIYGTPTFTEANSGKIVKGDTYFIIRIAGLNGNEGVQLTFEGPYEQK